MDNIKTQPMSICIKCGQYRLSASTGRCSCGGVFRITVSNNDKWEICLNCNGKGCPDCQNKGWNYLGK